MAKFLIYGRGKILERYKDEIDWNCVAAVADKQAKREEFFCGKPVVQPACIEEYAYDYVCIFSNIYFQEIKEELAKHISVEKIRSWKYIIDKEEHFRDLSFIPRIIDGLDVTSVLDSDINCLKKYILTRNSFTARESVKIYGIGAEGENVNIYDKCYAYIEMVQESYELLLLWNFENAKKNKKNLITTRFSILYTTYGEVKQYSLMEIENFLNSFGNVRKIFELDGIVWILDTKLQKVCKKNINIFVAMHKPCAVLSDELYKPICLGEDFYEEGFLTEQKGDNIAYLNHKINECTALYWIWKNTDCPYVGLNHYRRYFYNNHLMYPENVLDYAHASCLLDQYDIVAAKSPMLGLSVYDQLKASIPNEQAFEQAYFLIRKYIEIYQPGYLEAFEQVMEGYTFFRCNLFLTRREIFNQYCKWLFAFLIPAADEFTIDFCDSYSMRAIGFFAERMLTVWLVKQQYSLYALSVLEMDY